MLQEHLSQDNDTASRRMETIEAHVGWIHQHLLGGRLTKVLDLACGPGLYASRLARRGHECVGIDYSPASITFARSNARKENLPCRYRLQDIRRARYGSGFGLVTLIFGEFNVFRPSDATTIVRKSHRALAEGGMLLLEPHTSAIIRWMGRRAALWDSAERGLFSDRPHLRLDEHSWDPDTKTATVRYFIVDAATGDVSSYAQTFQAYSRNEYRSLLSDCGFRNVESFPSLTGDAAGAQRGLTVMVATK